MRLMTSKMCMLSLCSFPLLTNSEKQAPQVSIEVPADSHSLARFQLKALPCACLNSAWAHEPCTLSDLVASRLTVAELCWVMPLEG